MFRTYPAILKMSYKINRIHYVYDWNIFVEDFEASVATAIGAFVSHCWRTVIEAMITT
jgi:hypothetical protein